MTRVFRSIEEVEAAVNQPLEPGPWKEVTREDVKIFARLTGDRQAIHMEGHHPLVHGALLLSLATARLDGVYQFAFATAAIQRSYENVVFRQPVQAGTRIQVSGKIDRVRTTDRGAALVDTRMEVHAEGENQPALVASTRALVYSSPVNVVSGHGGDTEADAPIPSVSERRRRVQVVEEIKLQEDGDAFDQPERDQS